MSTQSTFITNDANKILKQRLSELISLSKALKFLVGFLYFSGIRELYEAIDNNRRTSSPMIMMHMDDFTIYEVRLHISS